MTFNKTLQRVGGIEGADMSASATLLRSYEGDESFTLGRAC